MDRAGLKPAVTDGESCFYVRIEVEQHETTGKGDSFRTGPALSRMGKNPIIAASSCVQIRAPKGIIGWGNVKGVMEKLGSPWARVAATFNPIAVLRISGMKGRLVVGHQCGDFCGDS